MTITNLEQIKNYPSALTAEKIAVRKTTGEGCLDYSNKSGSLTRILKKEGIFTKWKMSLEPYFDIVENPLYGKLKTLGCRLCSQSFKTNRDGSLTRHLKKDHGIDPKEYVCKFPEEIKHFTLLSRKWERESDLKNPENKIECPLCKKTFKKISRSHIESKHKMTTAEYLSATGLEFLTSLGTRKKMGNGNLGVKQEKEVSRKKDKRPVTCQICQETLTATGLPSHLYRKHDKLSSKEYVKKFGEFRQKYLELEKRKEESETFCKICNESLVSHKQLLLHIKDHGISWKDYFIKYFFNGVHPKCACGCGEKTTLIRHGKNDKGEPAYAREFIKNHRKNEPGYRTNTQEQRQRMRKSAIKRMEEGRGTFFNSGPSKGELEVVEYLKSLNVETEQNNRELLSGLEVDIYIPKYNLAIEYNGGYFHSDLFRPKDFHLKKKRELKEQGIDLIHIWECDWYKHSKIIKSILKTRLGKTKHRIYARKTKCNFIDSSTAQKFLRENHLQGGVPGKHHIGLFYEGTLISVMVFSPLRKILKTEIKEGSYELLRFCSKSDYQIIGGASKLLSFFKKEFNPDHILSYANYDWSNGEVYKNLGMNFVRQTEPGYFYVKGRVRYSRFQFQKHKLIQEGYDPLKTEYEIMMDRGFNKIWDCGNLVYEWKKPT